MSRTLKLAKYRGDPGLFGSIAKLGGSLLRMTPVGGVVGGFLDAIAKRKVAVAARPPAMFADVQGPGMGIAPYQVQVPTYDPRGRYNPNQQRANEVAYRARQQRAVMGTPLAGDMTRPGMIQSGYHYNKALRRYEIAADAGRNVQDPRTSARVMNEIVRNRSMNPLNPRALGRAFSRVKGAQRWARKLVTFQKKVKVARRK